jgi:hypothetical protein
MRQVIALAWKEWREVRWVLAVAAVAYVALPLIGGIESWWTYHQFGFAPSLWVTWSGGILGTLAGAFAAARDLNGPVAEFFQSRAIGVARRWLVKYAVGLATLWVACLVPLAIEVWTELSGHSWSYALDRRVLWFAPLWAVQYSLGFVCGSVTRRTGPAVMLAFGLTLLFYFLPLILPPLQAVSVAAMLDGGRPHRGPLALVATAICLASLGVAILFVRMDWRVRAGQGLMYWSIAIVVLLLFASAAFQVASNLPVLQEVALDPGETILDMHSDGHRGVLVTYVLQPPLRTGAVRPIEITPSGVRVGERIPIPDVLYYQLSQPGGAVWLPAHPDVFFTVHEAGETGLQKIQLVVLSLHPTKANPVVRFEVGEGFLPNNDPFWNFPAGTSTINGAGNELLVEWRRGRTENGRAVVDVSDPAHPRLAASDPPLWRGFVPLTSRYSQSFDYPRFDVGLPPMPGVSDRQRLEVALEVSNGKNAALTNDTLVFSWNDYELLLYRLVRVSDAPASVQKAGSTFPPIELRSGSAEFERAGSRQSSFVEKTLDMGGWWSQVTAMNGYAYLSGHGHPFDRALSRVTVLDIRDPARPRPVAHFAAPEKEPFVVQPLPDGRALIGGDKLYVVGSPPAHGRS